MLLLLLSICTTWLCTSAHNSVPYAAAPGGAVLNSAVATQGNGPGGLVPSAQPESALPALLPAQPESALPALLRCRCVGAGCGADFNPFLLSGTRGYPGIRARVNQRAFQYASGMIGELINSEIKKARIPDITRSTQPMIEGCMTVYNLYVSRYRCPQRVVIFPHAPNRIVLQVQNVDIGVTGNLGGQVTVLVPLQLFGVVQVNVHQVTVTVEASIERGPHGPYINICSCNIQIGYVDVCIENGGLVGQIVNSMLRRKISEQVQGMLPGEICKMLPSIVNEKINSRLSSFPQAIALTQLASLAGGALGGSAAGPSPQFCAANCGAKASSEPAPSIGIVSSTSSSSSSPVSSAGVAPSAPQIPTSAYATNSAKHVRLRSVAARHSKTLVLPPRTRVLSKSSSITPITSPSEFLPPSAHSISRHFTNATSTHNRRSKRATEIIVPRGDVAVARGARTLLISSHSRRAKAAGVAAAPLSPLTPPAIVSPANAIVAQNPAVSALCAQCPAADDPAGFIKELAAGLDLRRLSDLFLTIQVMNTYATENDFTVDLTGEFSPGSQGGTPFGPFPVQFPSPYDNHMVEAIISDYTINSLFYHMHKKGFLTFRIGPDAPKIGELLKTSCGDEEDDELEDHGVELDEEEEERRRKKLRKRNLRHLLSLRHKREASILSSDLSLVRNRRQDADAATDDGGLGGGSLSDLGICFGDILPAIREKYPNEKLAIVISTVRAPSILLSRARGGSAQIDLVADADIYIDGTNNKVGTITIAATVNIAIQLRGNRIYGNGDITTLKLTDRTGSLGLPQDALDNLGTLGKELLTKLANDALSKGIPLNIQQNSAIPITFFNPTVAIVEHGIYVAADLTISPALLGILGGCAY